MSHIIYGYVLSEKSLSFITSCFHSSLKTIPKLTVSLNPITNLILIPTMESSFQFTGKKELSLYFQFYHVYTSKLSRHVLTSNLLEHIILIIFFKSENYYCVPRTFLCNLQIATHWILTHISEQSLISISQKRWLRPTDRVAQDPAREQSSRNWLSPTRAPSVDLYDWVSNTWLWEP